jgi:adenine deaminase
MQVITGQVVNIFEKRIYPAVVTIENGKIARIDALAAVTRALDNIEPSTAFILPGFIDAHVHIESSMLVPTEFARLAVVHGTVGTVSDPHEIANVCGLAGVEFMVNDGNKVPFKFNFGAPSCVPATSFETAGASLNVEEVSALLQRDEIRYLSEMMNFPGVLNNDEEVMNKIAAAQQVNKPVDGHAPGLRGADAKKYINAGISTDHECFTREEALEKLGFGMKIIIREGSAARNFDALISLLNEYPEDMMFCSDDKHPDSLVEGHINQLCSRAVASGVDIFNVLQAACVNPVLHYKLNIGLLREGDSADLIVVEDLTDFKVLQTYIDGECVASEGKSTFRALQLKSITKDEGFEQDPINHFACSRKQIHHFQLPAGVIADKDLIPVIEALEGQLITNRLSLPARVAGEHIISDIENDILKIVVVNRYTDAPVAISFVKNFGLKSGAIASSVAHDSHNIVACWNRRRIALQCGKPRDRQQRGHQLL